MLKVKRVYAVMVFKISRVILLSLVFPSLLFASPNCEVSSITLREISRLRGLPVKKNVPCLIQNQDEVKKFLTDSIEKKIPKVKLENEEKLFKAIGFLPKDYNYMKGLVELYTSQLGGYYDAEKDRYVMAGWLPDYMQPSIASHELTHALQDQNFNLDAFLDDLSLTTDEILARSALVEGDATAVMLDYQKKHLNQPSLRHEERVDTLLLSNVMGGAMLAGTISAPQSLQMILYFPYNSGLRFVHFLLKEGGYRRVDEAFKKPPRCTKEVLHPEIFRKFKLQKEVPLSKEGYADRLGEFFISALLGMYTLNKLEAVNASVGWTNDSALLLEDGKVIWKTEWETPKDAEEFYNAYKQVLMKVYPKGGYDVNLIDRMVNVVINPKH